MLEKTVETRMTDFRVQQLAAERAADRHDKLASAESRRSISRKTIDTTSYPNSTHLSQPDLQNRDLLSEGINKGIKPRTWLKSLNKK